MATSVRESELVEGSFGSGAFVARTKRSRACHICKKRKGRCDGGIPCRWCLAHNLKCSTTPDQNAVVKKKKRDDNSRSTVLLNTRELGLLSEAEIALYIEMYLNSCQVDFNSGGAVVKHSKSPKSYSDFLVKYPNIKKYAMCAHTARGCGDLVRANNIMNEARSFARQSYDDMSIESVAGFILLCLYWVGNDANVMKHYGAIAASVLESLPQKDLPPHLAYAAAVYSAILASNAPHAEKMKTFAESVKDIVVPTGSALGVGQMRLLAKVFSQALHVQTTNCRSDLLAAMLCQVTFTDYQREALISEIAEYKSYEYQLVNPIPMFIVNFIEIFVYWRSGSIKTAVELATALGQSVTKETFRFASRFECDYLLTLSIILYEFNPALANKLHTYAEHIHATSCVAASMAQCSEHLSAFITECFPSELGHSHSRRASRPVQSVAQARMVDGILSLANRFIPSPPSSSPSPSPTPTTSSTSAPASSSSTSSTTSTAPANNSLMSVEGLHTLYTTLARLCPPQLSPFNPVTDLPPHVYCPFYANPPTTLSPAPDQITPSPSPRAAVFSSIPYAPSLPTYQNMANTYANLNIAQQNKNFNYSQYTPVSSSASSSSSSLSSSSHGKESPVHISPFAPSSPSSPSSRSTPSPLPSTPSPLPTTPPVTPPTAQLSPPPVPINPLPTHYQALITDTLQHMYNTISTGNTKDSLASTHLFNQISANLSNPSASFPTNYPAHLLPNYIPVNLPQNTTLSNFTPNLQLSPTTNLHTNLHTMPTNLPANLLATLQSTGNFPTNLYANTHVLPFPYQLPTYNIPNRGTQFTNSQIKLENAQQQQTETEYNNENSHYATLLPQYAIHNGNLILCNNTFESMNDPNVNINNNNNNNYSSDPNAPAQAFPSGVSFSKCEKRDERRREERMSEEERERRG